MTIHHTWPEILKTEAPHAYQSNPFRNSEVFATDGQILLMMQRMPGVRMTWDEYIERQYARRLRRALQRGARVVIVMWDNYQHVPQCKSMTQEKRRRNIPVPEFGENEQLGSEVPTNFELLILNRRFKARLIDLVMTRLPMLLHLRPGQELILDYVGHPVRYAAGSRPVEMTALAPMGEADVKFVRYARLFGDVIVDTIDGDALMISLIEMERSLRTPRADGSVPTLREVPQIQLYRMVTQTEDMKAERKKLAEAEKKKKEEAAKKKRPLGAAEAEEAEKRGHSMRQ